MTRYARFTFLCNHDERRAIVDLAARLQRSQSDAVRFVVIEAAKQLAGFRSVTELTDENLKQLKGETHGTD